MYWVYTTRQAIVGKTQSWCSAAQQDLKERNKTKERCLFKQNPCQDVTRDVLALFSFHLRWLAVETHQEHEVVDLGMQNVEAPAAEAVAMVVNTLAAMEAEEVAVKKKQEMWQQEMWSGHCLQNYPECPHLHLYHPALRHYQPWGAQQVCQPGDWNKFVVVSIAFLCNQLWKKKWNCYHFQKVINFESYGPYATNWKWLVWVSFPRDLPNCCLKLWVSGAGLYSMAAPMPCR